MPLTFTSPKVVKYSTSAGTTWAESQDFGFVKVWNGSSWQYINVRPYADVALVTFNPAGGTAGAPTFDGTYALSEDANFTITASSSVVWTWSGGSPFSSAVSVPSGTSAASITFTSYLQQGSFNANQFDVSASDGAETKYWTIVVESEDFSFD